MPSCKVRHTTYYLRRSPAHEVEPAKLKPQTIAYRVLCLQCTADNADDTMDLVRMTKCELYVRDQHKLWRQAGVGAEEISTGSSSSSGWNPSMAAVELNTATATQLVSEYIIEGRQHSIIDFSDHLDDISKDWMNPGLFA
ncbi:hypothetical protein CBR_g17083 [Chara braunii]|uniref:Uncharacterized protein n=1 Tax=Chara braunii TaxID=69332 RepID=A0A388KUX0_CHABU|nr:hypothetical protein CBR_g17083 [Chara braunii]|eukprot:GBG73743.1 hypothetical protein CBR_g17083 [Chara braunii]